MRTKFGGTVSVVDGGDGNIHEQRLKIRLNGKLNDYAKK